MRPPLSHHIPIITFSISHSQQLLANYVATKILLFLFSILLLSIGMREGGQREFEKDYSQ